jgi:enterochelin esterase-like enzyme
MINPAALPQGFILLVTDEAKIASAELPVHFAAGVNSWDPGHPDYQLTPRSDGRWQILFKQNQLGVGTEYKLALGSWGTEELDENKQTPPNRKIPMIPASQVTPGVPPIIEVVVPFFETGDEPHLIAEPYGFLDPEQVTGTVRRLQVFGGAGPMTGKQRDLLVWLPPGYDDAANADRLYPVLYVHDGRQAFFTPSDKPGEWGLDEAAMGLVINGEIEPLVIVAIPQGPERSRYAEYTTLPHAGSVPADMVDGAAHIDWLVDHVQPRVESAFRVESRPDRVGVGGFSYGACISIEAATRHPDRFGILLAETPALIFGTPTTYTEVFLTRQTWPARVWMTMGAIEWTGANPNPDDPRNLASVDALYAIRDHLESLGVTDRKMVLDPVGVHGEPAWNRRAPDALRFLFPPRRDDDSNADTSDSQRGNATPAPEPLQPVEVRYADRSVRTADDPDAINRPEALPNGFTIELVDASGMTSDQAPPYVAASWGGWNAGDPARRMSRATEIQDPRGTVWRLSFAPNDTGYDSATDFQFKFTLGSWARGEIVGNNTDIPNRTLPNIDASRLKPAEQPVLRFVAQNFRAPAEPAPVAFYDPFAPLAASDDITGTVRTLTIAGGGGDMAQRERDLLVWLPPGYDDAVNTTRAYPVLLLNDGERVFRHMPHTDGEWHADETAANLINRGLMTPTIIVGIPASGWNRAREYQPFDTLSGTAGDPAGDAYAAWLIDTVLPALRDAYRIAETDVNAQPLTGIGGAGLGAVAATHAALEYPDVFGRLLIESMPTLSLGRRDVPDTRWLDRLRAADRWPERIAMGMGTHEASHAQADARLNAIYVQWHATLGSVIRSAGVRDDRVLSVLHDSATHHEPAWAERLIDALQFLYPPAR